MNTSKRSVLFVVAMFGLLAAFVASPVASNAQSPTSPTTGPWECRAIDGYVMAVWEVYAEHPELKPALEGGDFDPTTVSSRELVEIGIELQILSEELSDIDADDIPRGLEEMHETLFDTIMIVGRVYETMGTDGMLAVLVYSDSLNAINERIVEDRALVEQRCPEEFATYDDFWPNPGEDEDAS